MRAGTSDCYPADYGYFCRDYCGNRPLLLLTVPKFAPVFLNATEPPGPEIGAVWMIFR